MELSTDTLRGVIATEGIFLSSPEAGCDYEGGARKEAAKGHPPSWYLQRPARGQTTDFNSIT